MALSAAGQTVGPPAWIRERWKCRPAKGKRPLHFCQVVAADSIENQALVVLARDAALVAGMPVVRAELILRRARSRVPCALTSERLVTALEESVSPTFAHRETLGFARRGELSIWDPVDNRHICPEDVMDCAFLFGLRLSRVTALPASTPTPLDRVSWYGLNLVYGRWFRVRTDDKQQNDIHVVVETTQG